VCRPNLGGEGAQGRLSTTQLNKATAQQRFVNFFASLGKAFRLRLFAVSRLFFKQLQLVVAAF
jgi:hypothetical protein